ncbi:MAG: hypothetical protein K2O56_07970, partial [Muribaculaceae bacterium]|nr:hypothetical protein [Muribaculaceae bacterium]
GCGSGLTHGISTKEDLRNLSTANELGSRVGNLPASHDNFLLFSVEEKNVETAIESVNRITVTMERASARFDLLNQTEGVSVLGMEFTNPYTSTLLDEATSEADQANLTVAQSPVTVDFTSEYGAEGLTGSLSLPGNYSARVYAYEHIADNGIYSVNAPEIKLTYKVEGEEDVKTATVSFNIPVKYAEDVTADATSFMGDDGNSYSGDEYIDGKVHAKGDYVVKKNNDDTYEVATTDKKYSILRNHLYRIRLIGVDDVNKPILLPLIEVLDWNEAEIIKGEEYVSDLTQADLNRRLYINRFKFNYVKAGFNPASGTVSFAADNHEGCFEANEYNTAWAGEYDANGNLTRVALYKDADDPHHTEYRLPTADELAYLSYENSGNINVFGEILNSDVRSDNVIWTDNTGAESIYTRYEGTNQYSVWYSKLNGDYITYKVRGLDPNAKPGDKNYVDVSAITANDSFWNDPNYVITLDMLIEEDALLASSAHNLLTDSAVKRFKGLSLDGADFSRITDYDPTVLTNKIRLMMVTAYDEVAAKK